MLAHCCFSHWCVSATWQPVPREEDNIPCQHPEIRSQGIPSLGQSLGSARPVQPRLWAAQEAEGMANVHVTVWLMVTASPYLQACKLQEQQEMAKGIYIATLCLSKGAVLHRLLWTFSLGEDMACAVSAGPPDVLVKLITPPEKEEGYYAFLVSSFSRWPDQGTFFSKGFPDPFSQGSERMGNSNGKM